MCRTLKKYFIFTFYFLFSARSWFDSTDFGLIQMSLSSDLKRQPHQTRWQNTRKRTKEWQNESTGRVAISFGVTENKSEQMSHSHLCKSSGSPGPKGGTESSDLQYYCCRRKQLEHSVRVIFSWYHSRVTSVFSELRLCIICQRCLIGMMMFLYVSALWPSSSRRRWRQGGQAS